MYKVVTFAIMMPGPWNAPHLRNSHVAVAVAVVIGLTVDSISKTLL